MDFNFQLSIAKLELKTPKLKMFFFSQTNALLKQKLSKILLPKENS